MKLKKKRGVEVPLRVRAFIFNVTSVPLESIAVPLSTFKWDYDKGDIYHWVDLLNHFDSFFEKFVKSRKDLLLEGTFLDPDDAFPKEALLQILRVTRIILENCVNKHCYSSYEHLSLLLSSTDADVVSASLYTLVAFVKKPVQSNRAIKWHGDTALNARLFSLSQGWGGKEGGLGLLACAIENGCDVEALKLGSTLHFEFYSGESQEENPEVNLKTSGLKVIHLSDLHLRSETDLQLLKQLIGEYNVPASFRFSLLTRLQFARAFPVLALRRQYLCIRLLAFTVLLQSNPVSEDLMAFFTNEPEFINELVELLHYDDIVPEDIRILSIFALTALSHDRSRQSNVLSAISAGGHRGILPSLMQKAAGSVTSGSFSCSVFFVEALLSLIAVLVSSSSGCAALREAGLIPTLLPLLKDMNPEHMHLVSSAVHILEAFMDYSNPAGTLFRDLGGLDDAITRLKLEVSHVEEASQKWHEESLYLVKGKLPYIEDGDAQQNMNVQPEALVSFQRRLLLKALLRAIALGTYAPGNAARLHGFEGSALPACLCTIFKHAKVFGGGVFSLAASVMSDLIHKDPTCFTVLDAAGLPAAFLTAITSGVLPSSEAVSCIPHSLDALCLNSLGLQAVRETNALSCFVKIFTSKLYLRALANETPGSIASGLDELMRHAPSLRGPGVDTCIAILKRIAVIGGSSDEALVTASENILETPVLMETDADTRTVDLLVGDDHFKVESVQSTDLETNTEASLPEYINNTARLLETILQNAETSRIFIEKNGIESLLRLYTLPSLPLSFGCSSVAYTLSLAFRAFSPQHASALSRAACGVLRSHLKTTLEAVSLLENNKFSNLGRENKDKLIRCLSATESFLALASVLVRSTNTMMTELNASEAEALICIGKLHREMLWQISLHDDIKLDGKEGDSGNSAAATAQTIGSSGGEGDDETGVFSVPRYVNPISIHNGPPSQWRMDPSHFPIFHAGEGPHRRRREHGGTAEILAQMARFGRLARRPEVSQDIENALNMTGGSQSQETPKHKSPECLNLEVMTRLVTAARGLYVALGKAMVVPSRRRDDIASPSVTAKAVAAVLARILLENLSFNGHCGFSQLEIITSVKCRYLGKVVDDISAIVFDSRRRTCNTLMVNNLYAYGVFNQLFLTFMATCQLLWRMLEPLSSLTESDKAENEKAEISLEKNIWLLETLKSYTKFMDDLVTSSLLMTPMSMVQLLVQQNPGRPISVPRDVETFVRTLQANVLEVVLPIWNHVLFPRCSPIFISSLAAILTHIYSGIGDTTGPRNGGSSARFLGPPPDETSISTIVEMGFSRARAEEALRHVETNSVEMAMEWLFAHPEEPREDDDLARALALSLGSSDTPSEHVAAKEDEASVIVEKLKAVPVEDILSTCLTLLQSSDALAFPLTDLLVTVSNRNKGLDRPRVICYLISQLKQAGIDQLDGDTGPLTTISHTLALILNEDSTTREIAAANGIVKTALDILAGFYPSKATTESPVSVPKWVTALLLVLDHMLQYKPKINQDSSDGVGSGSIPGDGAMTASVALVGDKRPEMEVDNKESDGDPFTAVLGKPTGYMSENEECQAMKVACNLLQTQLPSATVQAVLQLCARLTKTHRVAMQFLESGGLTAILRLPRQCLFPGFDSVAAAIIRHLLEDPQTLQQAMESEIRHALLATLQRHNGRVTPRMFLTAMAPVISRDPTIFMQAAAAVCQMENIGTRPYITLSKEKEREKEKDDKDREKCKPSMVVGHEAGSCALSGDGNAKGHDASVRSLKGHHKRVPFSFSQVIDQLLEVILHFPPHEMEAKDVCSVLTTAMDFDELAAKDKGKAKVEECSLPNHINLAETSADLAKVAFILKLMTEILLMYSSAVGVVLRRDSESSQGRGPFQGTSEAIGHGGLLYHILHRLLPYPVDKTSERPGENDWREKLSDKAAYFLMAICVRSGEGRRRIIAEVSGALFHAANTFEKSAERKTQPPSRKVHAFLDLINLILSAHSSSSNSQFLGFSTDMAKTMIDTGLVQSLTGVLQVIDLDHPETPKLVNALLKALESLTRAANTADQVYGAGGNSQKKGTQEDLMPSDGRVPITNRQLPNGNQRSPPIQSGDQLIRDVGFVEAGLAERNTSEATGADRTIQMENDSQLGADGTDRAHLQVEAEDLMHDNSGDHITMEENTGELTFRVEHREIEEDEEMEGDDNDDDDGDEEEEDDEDDEDDMEGAGLTHLSPPYADVEDHEDTGLGDDFAVDMVEEEDEEDDWHEGQVIEVRWRDGLTGLNHVQVLGNTGPANLADLGRDPFQSINMDDIFSSFRRTAVIDRQRPASYRAVLEHGLGDRGGAFHHPLLARPSLSTVVSSVSGMPNNGLWAATGAIRDAEALFGGGFDVSHFMYEGPNMAERTAEGLFGERGVGSQPQALLDFSIDPMYLMGRRGGRADGRLSSWTDDGQPQAGAHAAAVAQAIEEHFVSYLQSLVPRRESSPEQTVIIPAGSEPQQLHTAVSMERADSGTPVIMSEGERQDIDEQRSQSGQTLLHPDSPRGVTLVPSSRGESTHADVQMEEERNGTETRDIEVEVNESRCNVEAVIIVEENVDAERLTDTERLEEIPCTSEASQRQADANNREQDEAIEEMSDPANVVDAENVAASLMSENEALLSGAHGGAENPPQENAHINETNNSANRIDPTFLDALPDDLRAEVLASQQSQTTRPATTPQASVEAPADDIDPEFLAALPPDIQAEVLAQQRAQRLIHSHQPDGQPVDMDSASIIATFPTELREEVLLTSSEQVLAALPPNLLAEAQLLRERAMNQYHNRGFFGGSHRIGARRNNLGVGTVGSGSVDRGVGVSSVGRRAGAAASNIMMKEVEGRPLVDVSALKAMLQLLRLAQPLGKGLLQRLLLNLCAHSVTRASLVMLLLDMLRPEVECSMRSTSTGSNASAHRLFGCQWNVVYARSQLTDGVPPLVSRRALEVLTYLSRNHPHVARLLLYLEPTDVRELSQTFRETRIEKGKGKLVDDVSFSETSEDQTIPLTLLLKLLNQPLYSRSSAHLEQVLGLLEVVTANLETKVEFHAQSETTQDSLKTMLDGATNASSSGHSMNPASLNQEVLGDEQNQSSDAANHGDADITQVSAPTVGSQDTENFGHRNTAQKVDLVAILLNLPEPELRHLCRLLAHEGLSDVAYNRVAEILKKFAQVAPAHRKLLISELAEAARDLSNPAVGELTSLGETEHSVLSKNSMAGAATLRVLQCLGVLTSLEGNLIEKEHDNSIEQDQDEGLAIIKELNKVLEPLWQGLSMCIGKIENRLSSTSLFVSGTSSTNIGHGVASPLPPEAQRVLPFIEAFFVLCEKLRLGCSPFVHMELSTATACEIKEAASSSDSAMIPASKHSLQTHKRLEGDITFIRFADKHRKMLNAFVRQNPALLDRSFSLLLKAPRLIDFDNKRAHFRTHIRQQNEHQHSHPLRISVRRAYVLEDSYNQLRMRTPEEMKGRLTVQFQGEEGIDAGGLTREWYQVLSRVIFDKGALLFTTVGNESSFQPNPNSVYQTEHLSYFKFVGRVVGKALYDGQLLDVYFTRSFYKHILGVKVTYHDIEAVDPDYYKNLKWVLENDVTSVDYLFFSVDANEETRILYEKSEVSDIELVPGGRNIRVTEENKHEYVDLVAEHKLTTAIRPQINAFLEGFNELIPRDLISIFHDKELELLISGLPEIDLDDLKANTEYTGYTAASPVVQWYWEVVWTFSKEDLARLLQFVTGTSKVPLEGFRALQGISGPQKFQIHKAYGAPERLPSAHTCFNQLDLPEYSSKEQLQERLLLAIHEASEGFGFG